MRNYDFKDYKGGVCYIGVLEADEFIVTDSIVFSAVIQKNIEGVNM